MKNEINKKYKLNNESVDVISQSYDSFLSKRKVDNDERIKLRLSLENALLCWQSKFGFDKEIKVSCFERLGNVHMQVQCTGEEENPFENQPEDELGNWVSSLRSSLYNEPVFDYFNHTNRISFKCPKPHINRLLLIGIFLLSGIIIGLLGAFLPQSIKTFACDNILSPISSAYLGAFTVCGIPLIFLSIVTGILGIGNIHTFSLLGSKLIKHLLSIIVCFALIAVAIGSVFWISKVSDSSQAFSFGYLFSMLMSFIPTGLLDPLINCDAMQLIVLGVVFATAMLVLNKANGYLSAVLIELNELLLEISKWLASLIPFFILCSLINSMWSSVVGDLIKAWKSLAVTTALQGLMIFILTIPISLRFHVSPLHIISKTSKLFLIALGTNSCTASISENFNCSINKFGVDPKIVKFGIPIGTTVFKPATVIRLVILSLFMAEGLNVNVSIGWLVMLFVLSVAISIAVPAIPGGVLIMCGTLFAGLGIPSDALVQMLTTDFLFDAICTAFNQIAVSLELVSFASKVNMINSDTLKK